MTDVLLPDYKELFERVRALRPRQVERVRDLVDALAAGTAYWRNPESFFATESFSREFGDQLLLHHMASEQPLTKDKFEYAIVSALNDSGFKAEKMPNGNPGEDIVMDGVPWSLKTQSDKSIKTDYLWISKYMELGKGRWETSADVEALRSRMFAHMLHYDRIFSLRCLPGPSSNGLKTKVYELVEIPKAVLQSSASFPVEMKANSRQTPKPASVYVSDSLGPIFELYFDGGTERKLQVKKLVKRVCTVHATWSVKLG
jgi:type II restriction enzyme